MKNDPPTAPLCPWLWPTNAYMSISQVLLMASLICLCHSKWPEIAVMNFITVLLSSAKCLQHMVCENNYSLWQWLTINLIFFSRVCNFCEEKRRKAHQMCTLSPCFEWSCRKFGANVQESTYTCKSAKDTNFVLQAFYCLNVKFNSAPQMKLLASCFFELKLWTRLD